MQYVTIAKLHNKLGKDFTQAETKKLVERMAAEGYIEKTPANKRMGEDASINLTLKSFLPIPDSQNVLKRILTPMRVKC